jgi:hypothetical protein
MTLEVGEERIEPKPGHAAQLALTPGGADFEGDVR